MTDHRPRGRPAIHPAGTTPSDRAKLSRAAVIAAGGSRLEIIMDRDTAAALEAVLSATGEARTEAVSRLIHAEAKKVGKKGKP